MKRLVIMALFASFLAQGERDMKINSSSFADGAKIPRAYAYTGCGGLNKSPQISWSDAPSSTKSFALICQDPDAPRGTFYHWVIYNIPPAVTNFSEGVEKAKKLSSGALQGTNDFRLIGYDGPCPPSGAHRYIFTVYALDAMLKLPAGAHAQDVLDALEGHVIAQGNITGKYSAGS